MKLTNRHLPKDSGTNSAVCEHGAHTQESYGANEEEALRAVEDLEARRLKEAAKVVREGYAETL